MRADAKRNRERLLEAARLVFIESGPRAPLEVISRRAGVGIATLYRHFPDRHILVRAVAADVLVRTAEEGLASLAEGPDAFSALRRYMHAALDIGVAAIMPLLAGDLDADPSVLLLRDEAARAQRRLILRAKREMSLRREITFGDIGLVLNRFSRPIGGLEPGLESDIAHRHLDVFIDGLRADSATGTLRGPALSLNSLRGVRHSTQP